MGYPIIACLVFLVVTLPWVEGQFPRDCIDLDSLRDKICCPIPKGFTTRCGCDGDRGKCQELTIRDWTFKYSHYRPFQMEDERQLAACYLPQSLQMQRKLCRLRLQQMRLWLLWKELHAEEKFNTKKFSKPDSRGERSIHEIRQHVQALCK